MPPVGYAEPGPKAALTPEELCGVGGTFGGRGLRAFPADSRDCPTSVWVGNGGAAFSLGHQAQESGTGLVTWELLGALAQFWV